jgi:hypothetical protein
VERIARTLHGQDLLAGLTCELPASDLQSLMLHVYRERSARRTPAELLEQLQRVSMLRASDVDPRKLLEIERMAFECAVDFDAVDLAPVAPLGINAVLGQIDQNWCLATVRSAEVLADPTTAQALECARRRRAGVSGEIRLCSRGRMLRLQPLDTPGHSPHFTVFSLVSAGLAQSERDFAHESLLDQIGVHLRLMHRLTEQGYAMREITVSITDTADDEQRSATAQERVLTPLAGRFPGVECNVDRTRQRGRSYYRGLCFSIDATDPSGARVNLCDGGFTDWTQRLLANARERLLVSGIGLDLLARRLRASEP